MADRGLAAKATIAARSTRPVTHHPSTVNALRDPVKASMVRSMMQSWPYSQHTKSQWRRLRQRVAGQLIAPLDDEFHGLVATATICGCQCRDCHSAAATGTNVKPLPRGRRGSGKGAVAAGKAGSKRHVPNGATLVSDPGADSDLADPDLPIYELDGVRVVTFTDAIRILQVSAATFKNYRVRGELQIVRPSWGGQPGLVALSELRQFLNRKASSQQQPPQQQHDATQPSLQPNPSVSASAGSPVLRDPFDPESGAPAAPAAVPRSAVPAPPPAPLRSVRNVAPPITRSALNTISNLESWNQIKRVYEDPDVIAPASADTRGLSANLAAMSEQLERRFGGEHVLVVEKSTGLIVSVGAREPDSGEGSELLAAERPRPKEHKTTRKGGGTGQGRRYPRDAAELAARLREAGCELVDHGTHSEVLLPNGSTERLPHHFNDPRGLRNRVTTLAHAGVDVRK